MTGTLTHSSPTRPLTDGLPSVTGTGRSVGTGSNTIQIQHSISQTILLFVGFSYVLAPISHTSGGCAHCGCTATKRCSQCGKHTHLKWYGLRQQHLPCAYTGLIRCPLVLSDLTHLTHLANSHLSLIPFPPLPPSTLCVCRVLYERSVLPHICPGVCERW